LARLSDDEREVLLLVAWERLTPAEAAETLGIPQGTARSRLHRARALMRGELVSIPVTVSTGITKEHLA
jgi:RNA polymerase sigma-70 factor (ECF subfamily)